MAFHINQLKALYIKRLRHASRDYKAVASQVALPAVFVVLAMFVATSFPPVTGRIGASCLPNSGQSGHVSS